MADSKRFGRRIRAARVEKGLTQAALAGRLGVSASYLNLLEHDRRSLSAALLLRLAQALDLDVRSLDPRGSARVAADLSELFTDPMFEGQTPSAHDIEEIATGMPVLAEAILALYRAHRSARESADMLAERAVDRIDLGGTDRSHLSSDEVSDFITRSGNYFPALEETVERVWRDASLHVGDDFFGSLAVYLEARHGVRVRVLEVRHMGGAVRRFDPERRELHLSEVLRRGSRNFQLAHQIGLLAGSPAIDEIVRSAGFGSEASRFLCRVALANYFAGAILMPYEPFLRAAQAERYDIDLLGHRFRSSFEQVCHRLTTLRRPNAEGVPFYFLRIDIAGNVSKRYSPGRLHFPRFSGLCPLWNVHAAFLRPGMMNVQLSRLPDGATLFSVARTVRKHYGGYHARNVLYAIGLGCDLAFAKELVYSDGVDLTHPEAAVPVGITCRSCEREHCEARAFPSLRKPLRVDENARGVSFYASIKDE